VLHRNDGLTHVPCAGLRANRDGTARAFVPVVSDDVLLLVAMADRCRDIISTKRQSEVTQPPSLQPEHLLWMCRQVVAHRNDWRATKVHRWIGFVQAALIAGGMLDLHEAKAMFDQAKIAYGVPDDDLLDHLDPSSPFRLELGGQG